MSQTQTLNATCLISLGVSNILSLGWGISRTYLSEKEKCRWSWIYTKKKSRGKNLVS